MEATDLFSAQEAVEARGVSTVDTVGSAAETVAPTVISFVIPGEPVPFARAGGNGSIRFTPKRQRDFMSLARYSACQAMAGAAPLEGPVELTVEAVFLAPTGWSKKKRAETVWKLSRPDLSNIEKLVEDSLNEIVFVDDTQVVRRGPGTCKRYGERAETRIKVRVLDASDLGALR